MIDSPDRPFIPFSRPIMALDTMILRDIGYDQKVPCWFLGLAGISRMRCEICIPEVCMMELLASWRDGRMDDSQKDRIGRRLRNIISRKLPILPSNKPLFAMMGIVELVDQRELAIWRKVSKKLWDSFLFARNFKSFYQAGSLRGDLDEVLEELRRRGIQDYVDLRETRSQLSSPGASNREVILQTISSSMNERFPMTKNPSASKRLMAYGLLHMALDEAAIPRGSTPFNPQSDKHRNDGIDVKALNVLSLPAYFVTRDSIWQKRIESISSQHGKLIISPGDLCGIDKDGAVAPPSW